MTPHATRVLGIDPGTIVTGYGIVDGTGSAVRYVASGAIRPPRSCPMPERLCILHREISALVEKYRPQVLAVEEAFYGDNPKTAIKLGQARGVIIVAGSLFGLDVAEYAPRFVKQAVVGRGGATKEQVQFMVARILALREPPEPADAADAIAVALCHILRPIKVEVDGAPLTRAQKQLRAYGALLRLPPGDEAYDK